MGKALLDVLQGREPSRRPVWLMRQAGRYLPEYRQLRASAGSFLKLCYHAEMAAEVTLQPLRRYDFDAAIVFSDILVVPHGMGADLSFSEGEGPILSRVMGMADVVALSSGEGSSQFSSVCETLSRVKDLLLPHQSLIGFCGAPWTVASYMVEGRGSNRELALHHAREGTAWFQVLVDRLVTSSIIYLAGQIRSGAEVVQIFDSWAGDLPGDLRRRWVVEPIAKIMKGLAALGLNVPVIVFARGLGAGQVSIATELGPACIGIEQGTDLREVLAGLPRDVAIQGNLDPNLLLGDRTEMTEAALAILASVPMQRHVFNLGHGILPATDPARVTELVSLIRRYDEKSV